MSARFEESERVTIRMASNNVLPWGIQFDAWFVRGPSGPGDVWEFDALDGTRFCLNGNSSEFVGFWRAFMTPPVPRLSIPGGRCVHCDALMGVPWSSAASPFTGIQRQPMIGSGR